MAAATIQSDWDWTTERHQLEVGGSFSGWSHPHHLTWTLFLLSCTNPVLCLSESCGLTVLYQEFKCTNRVELPSYCFSVPPCLSRQKQWTSLGINQFFQSLSGTGKPKQHIPSTAFSHPICKAQLSPLPSGRTQDDLSTSATVIRTKLTYISRFRYKLESGGGGVEVCCFFIIKIIYMWTCFTTSSPGCFLRSPPVHRALALNYSQ